jgi:hypothetical protein
MLRGHSRTLAQSAVLPREHEIDNLSSGDEKRKGADCDADERGLPPSAPRVGEDGEATEGKPEKRGHRAGDPSEWKGEGAESPHTYTNRKD